MNGKVEFIPAPEPESEYDRTWRNCANCGAAFKTLWTDHQYCSEQCRVEATGEAPKE